MQPGRDAGAGEGLACTRHAAKHGLPGPTVTSNLFSEFAHTGIQFHLDGAVGLDGTQLLEGGQLTLHKDIAISNTILPIGAQFGSLQGSAS